MINNATFVICEVGSWHGRSSRAIADNLPEGGVLICCDSWNGSSGEPDAHATAKLREGDDAFLAFWHNNHDHILSGKIIPIRMQGANAAAMLRYLGVQVDVCFIDADHSYEGCKADILNFRELVKDGGLLCGHDYGPDQLSWVGVQQAVNELVPNVQCAPNTTIWFARLNKTVNIDSALPQLVTETSPQSLSEVLGLPVSESFGEYRGFFSA